MLDPNSFVSPSDYFIYWFHVVGISLKSSQEKWNDMQRRSRAKYAAKLASRPRTKIKDRSSNEFPVAFFNADRWFRRWIIWRDGECVTKSPECSGPLEASHVFPVSTGAIFRFDERLVYAQCQFMNQRHSHDISALRSFVDGKFGKGFYDRMKIQSKKIKRWTIPELRGIIQEYKKRLDQLSKTV